MNTEHVDIGLARYSDWAFTSSVVVLVVALLLLAVELAYSRGRKVESRELVGATVGADSATPGIVAAEPKRPLDERVGKAGLALVYVGIGLLLVCIVLRGLATERVPWGNMYEFINLTCFSGLIAAAVVLRRPQYRALWVFVLVPVLILLTVSGRWLYTNAAPVMPALQSYWLPIHVSVVSIGSGVFLVAGVASILFLLKMSPLGRPELRGRVGPHRGAAARRADAGPHRLSHNDFRVPCVRLRRHLRRDLGGGGVGPLLGLGPQGDGVVHRVGGLRGVPARALDGRLARQEGGLDQRRRLRRNGVQPVLHQPGDRRVAFVRWGGLSGSPRRTANERGLARCLTSRRVFAHNSGSAILRNRCLRGTDEWTDPTPPNGLPLSYAAHPVTPQYSDPPPYLDLSTVALLGQPKRAPSQGWRKWLYLASFKLINVGESPKVKRINSMVAQVQQPLRGCYRIALLSLKGGVGKTTVTATLGATFASIRGDRVVAVDANPDRGTLSQKVPLETPATVRHLLRDAEGIAAYSDVRAYTSQGPSRLEVLASESDPAVSEAFSSDDYTRTLEVLERFYSLVLTDCGTGMLHSAMSAVLDKADVLIVISSGSVDGARSASATLDWLDAHGHQEMVRNSIAVINAVRPRSGKVDLKKVVDHFSRRCRAVNQVPFDPHLEEGAEISLDRLKPETREALIELAAVVADGFTGAKRPDAQSG